MDSVPALDRFYRDHSSQANLLLLAYDGSAAAVNACIGDRGYELPALLDSDGAIAASYGVWAYPTIFIIDAAGWIAQRHEGDFTDAELWAAVQPLVFVVTATTAAVATTTAAVATTRTTESRPSEVTTTAAAVTTTQTTQSQLPTTVQTPGATGGSGYTLPMAVGIAAALLVLAGIVVYLILRRGTRARGS